MMDTSNRQKQPTIDEDGDGLTNDEDLDDDEIDEHAFDDLDDEELDQIERDLNEEEEEAKRLLEERETLLRQIAMFKQSVESSTGTGANELDGFQLDGSSSSSFGLEMNTLSSTSSFTSSSVATGTTFSASSTSTSSYIGSTSWGSSNEQEQKQEQEQEQEQEAGLSNEDDFEIDYDDDDQWVPYKTFLKMTKTERRKFLVWLFLNSPRLSISLAYYFCLSFIHFAILPASHVSNSMINRSSRLKEQQNTFAPPTNLTKPKKKRTKTRYTPLQNFFRSKGHVGIFPRHRVIVMLYLGIFFSVLLLIFTQDEFLFGRYDPEGVKRMQENNTNIDSSVYPVQISFESVGCFVKNQERPILANVSGVIPPGQITGIMGPSGAGKSTFAALLLGRGERICSPPIGSISLNDERRSLNAILDRVGFVPQVDSLLESLTVEEALRFSASWRLPWYVSEEAKERALEETLELLELEHIRHERIGGLINRGISGGEKKRVSIGVELIMNPSVLVMDEPSTGLDNAAAFKLMNRLRTIADRKGVSVVVVLHVPSARVFQLLDNLILLQHGRPVYVGPRQQVLAAMGDMGFNATTQRQLDTDKKQKRNSSSAHSPAVTIPEFLLDVVAGVIPYPKEICPYEDYVDEIYHGKVDNCKGKETLPSRWDALARAAQLEEQEYQRTAGQDRDTNEQVEQCASSSSSSSSSSCSSSTSPSNNVDNKVQKVPKEDPTLSNNKATTKQVGQKACQNLRRGPRRWACVILHEHILRRRRAVKNPHEYPRVPKPGLFRQISLWFVVLLKITLRKGILLQVFATATIGIFCAWIRSYSDGWDARAMSAFFVSVTVSSQGAFEAVFTDDIDPVKRAAESGMVLGAHHNAMVALAVFKFIFFALTYSVAFHLTLWLRNSDAKMLSLKRNLEMTYIISIGYLVHWTWATLLCVFARHDFRNGAVLTTGYLIWAHVFAMYSPNARQIALDSFLVDCYSLKRPIRKMCTISPCRYFIEAFTVWDSDIAIGQKSPSNAVRSGRQFMLNYFGYRDENLSICLSVLQTFLLSLVIVRWGLFGWVNSTDFHTLYDSPLFVKFWFKQYFSLSLSLAILVLIHEERQRMMFVMRSFRSSSEKEEHKSS